MSLSQVTPLSYEAGLEVFRLFLLLLLLFLIILTVVWVLNVPKSLWVKGLALAGPVGRYWNFWEVGTSGRCLAALECVLGGVAVPQIGPLSFFLPGHDRRACFITYSLLLLMLLPSDTPTRSPKQCYLPILSVEPPEPWAKEMFTLIR